MKVSLNNQIRICDHCGAKNIHQTYEIQLPDKVIYIGRVCISKLLDIDTSGNKYKALIRVQKKLDTLEDLDI